MKKTLLALLLLGAAGLSASAQTEFRHISFDEACTAAKNENKLVFIDFFTDWCGPCKKMSAQTFPEKAVGDFMNAKFIPVKYNAEKEGVDLAKRFQIKAYPTYIIANDKGEEVARFSGYMESEQFIDKVNAALDPEMKPERSAARYQSGERTPKLVNTYAMQVLQESKDEKAGLKIIDDYFNSLTDEQRVAPENAFIFLTYTVNLDDPRSIYLDKNIDRFPAETKAKAMERLQRLYSSKFSTYFSGYMFREGKYNADEFAAFKKRVAELGAVEAADLESMCEFIEKRPTCNDTEYLAYCAENLNKLSKHGKEMLIMNTTRLIEPSTPELKAGISKFIRSNLADLPAYAIQMAGYTLNQVEN